MPKRVDAVETATLWLWSEQFEKLIKRLEPKLHGFVCWVVFCPETTPPIGFVVAVPGWQSIWIILDPGPLGWMRFVSKAGLVPARFAEKFFSFALGFAYNITAGKPCLFAPRACGLYFQMFVQHMRLLLSGST